MKSLNILLIAFLLTESPYVVFADDNFQKQAEALNIIAEFANRICGEYKDIGSSESVDISGEITTEINGLLKKLAALGISGTAAYYDKAYQGVLQEDLIDLLKNQMHCKENIALQFKPLVPMQPKESDGNSNSHVPVHKEEHNLTGRWNSVFGPVSFTQTGQEITGTLYYSAEQLRKIGATANFKGKRVDNTIAFVWYVFADTPENPTGKGVLTLSNDGNKLDGYFTDKNAPGDFASFQLVRDQF